MFRSNSISISSQPYFFISSIKILPNLFVFLLLSWIWNLLFHHYDFILSSNVFLRQFSMIEMNLSVHFLIIVIQTNDVFVILMSFQWNWTVIVEEQVEQRNIFSISVVLETQRLLSDFKHTIAIESKENFWRSIFSCLLYFICHILDFYINIL